MRKPTQFSANSATDKNYIKLALAEAHRAYKKGEVPVGAVIIKDGKIISQAHNLRERKQNALYHAEILAIKRACRKLKTWRLTGCDLYVTLEPCPMCAGAILQARISNVYFGAFDPKGGACGSVINVLEADKFNHNVNVVGGIMEQECGGIIKQFFRERRVKTGGQSFGKSRK